MNTTFQKILSFSIIITLLLVAGCKKTTESTNAVPVISAVTVNPPSVPANGFATVNVTATDADNDALTYTYAPNGGAISGSGAAVNWTAPGTAGAYSVAITVSDGNGGEATGSGNLTVTAAVTQITGTAHFLAGVNGDLNNSKVSIYTSLDNWNINSPIKFGAVSGSGASASFTLTGVNPGNYWLDIWKDNDNDGVWATSGDYVGWYGTGGLSNFALSEFQIANGQTVVLDIPMYIVP
jgi:hypothetical protein